MATSWTPDPKHKTTANGLHEPKPGFGLSLVFILRMASFAIAQASRIGGLFDAVHFQKADFQGACPRCVRLEARFEQKVLRVRAQKYLENMNICFVLFGGAKFMATTDGTQARWE